MVDDDNVISLAGVTKDAKFDSPDQVLRDAIKEREQEGSFMNGRKLLILALNDDNDMYDISYMQSGMRMSECVTLCEIAKTIFKREIGYI